MKDKKLTIEFKINLKNFVPEFSIRLLYLLICILIITANYKSSESENSYLIASLFVFFNVVISVLTFYRTYRRKATIVNFIKMRIKNHTKYNDFEIDKKIDFNLFYLIAFVAAILFCGSTICIFYVLDLIPTSSNSVFFPIIFFIILPIYLIIVSTFKSNFISGEIKAISVEGKKLPISEMNSIKAFLKKKNEELSSTNEKLTSTLGDLKKKTVFIEEQARGYVSCGTKKVLRQKGILSKTNLKLTKEYQTAVKANSYAVNYFESDLIECGTGGKIEVVLPERDPASYKVDGYKLTILNTESFWKTDKIVVIVKE